MVTQELIDHIKSQKQKKVTNEVIKERLLKNNWIVEDINQAFLQIDTPQITQAPITSQQLISSPNNIDLSTEKKPKIITSISVLIFLIASLYVLSTVTMLGIITIIEVTMGANDLVFSFLKYFPTFGIIPIMLSFLSFYFFYLSFKIRNGSKFSLWLGISSLLLFPTMAGLISQKLITPLVQLAASYGNLDTSIPSLPINPGNIRFGDPIFVLTIISVILIAISYKNFRFINDPISKKGRVFLVLVAVILVVPTVSIISLDYIKAQDTDYGFTKARKTADYHIYKPSVVPNDLTYATKFIVGKELANKQTAVQVTYTVPIDELLKYGQSNIIVVKQVDVEPGFNPELFAETFVTDANQQKITLSNALDQTGYLSERLLGDSTFRAVVFLTNDNILVTLISPTATTEELTQLAESLE